MSGAPPRSDVFSAVGDARRRRILELLGERERSVGELAAELGIAQPSVTQHLAILRGVGLVDFAKRGTSSIYRLEVSPLSAISAWIGSLG